MPKKCIVTRAYEAQSPENQALFRKVIQDPNWTGGMIAAALRLATKLPVDHAAVDHYRRKIAVGKVTLESS